MKRLLPILVLMSVICFSQTEMLAQSFSKPSVVRIDSDARFPENSQVNDETVNSSTNRTDDFTYYTTPSGIYISFQKQNNNVKLFALTGQVLWSGELVSGKFFIPTGEGIFFLRVNNKTHKISCK